MSELLATKILWSAAIVIYIFGVIPLIGRCLGATCSYGEYDLYQNAMGRGILAHVAALLIYIMSKAIIVKLF